MYKVVTFFILVIIGIGIGKGLKSRGVINTNAPTMGSKVSIVEHPQLSKGETKIEWLKKKKGLNELDEKIRLLMKKRNILKKEIDEVETELTLMGVDTADLVNKWFPYEAE